MITTSTSRIQALNKAISNLEEVAASGEVDVSEPLAFLHLAKVGPDAGEVEKAIRMLQEILAADAREGDFHGGQVPYLTKAISSNQEEKK